VRSPLLWLLALGAVGLAVWLAARPSRAADASWRAVEALVRARHADVPTVTTAELAAWLDDPARTAPALLDAREPPEYAVSHLPGARRVDPGAGGSALADALPDIDRRRPVVVYCSVGVRSGGVAARLADAGFERVWNLEGSIFRWANEGRPLVRDGRPVREVHPYDAVWGRLLRPDLRADVDGGHGRRP
jgi:rhodanese-related sulfurtransferase